LKGCPPWAGKEVLDPPHSPAFSPRPPPHPSLTFPYSTHLALPFTILKHSHGVLVGVVPRPRTSRNSLVVPLHVHGVDASLASVWGFFFLVCCGGTGGAFPHAPPPLQPPLHHNATHTRRPPTTQAGCILAVYTVSRCGPVPWGSWGLWVWEACITGPLMWVLAGCHHTPPTCLRLGGAAAAAHPSLLGSAGALPLTACST
jgi:hypothetical protein